MTPPHVSLDDAVHVYALTIAYLHHAKFDPAAIVQAMHIKEVAGGIFYFWRRQRYDQQGEQASPVVICVYQDKIWKVQLLTGETLTLHDRGSEWELAQEHDVHEHSQRNSGRQKIPKRNCPPT